MAKSLQWIMPKDLSGLRINAEQVPRSTSKNLAVAHQHRDILAASGRNEAPGAPRGLPEDRTIFRVNRGD